MDNYFTPPKIAEILGVNHSKVISWIRTGRLRAINVVQPGLKRPRYRVSESDLKAFLASITVSPPPVQPRRRSYKPTKNYFND